MMVMMVYYIHCNTIHTNIVTVFTMRVSSHKWLIFLHNTCNAYIFYSTVQEKNKLNKKKTESAQITATRVS